MEYPQALLARLGELQGEPFSGTVYRWTFEGIPPDRPNTRGARWNPPGVAALYTGLSKEVVRAESDYLVEVQGIPPTRNRQMHAIGIDLKKVLRLTDWTLLKQLGVDEVALSSIDHSKCRLVGGAVERLGYEGLIIPSARGAANNLVIFTTNLPYDVMLEALSSEALI